jgi:hypothetical protein
VGGVKNFDLIFTSSEYSAYMLYGVCCGLRAIPLHLRTFRMGVKRTATASVQKVGVRLPPHA